MHRDKRLGLALGILLLGVVGAFFFRNEGQSELPSPELDNPVKLDQAIAENPVGPYLVGLEDDEKQATPPAQRVSRSSAVEGDDPWGTPDFLNDKQADPDLPGADGPPNPIDTRAVTVDGIPIPRENAAWEPVSVAEEKKSSRQISAKPTATETVDGYIIHRVKQGDTLSDLAQRYLGSSARFRELYEANHNVLRSPDDLRVGSMIRIPAKKNQRPKSDRRADRIETQPISTQNDNDEFFEPAAKPQTPVKSERPAVESGPELAPPKTEETKAAPKKKRLFIPVRRSPLVPRGPRKRASRPDVPVDEIPRQLTQIAPGSSKTVKSSVPVKEVSAVFGD